MNRVDPITNDNLFEALSLIKVGFDMPQAQFVKFHNWIIAANGSCGIFGYVLYSDDSLVGAILTPCQGNIGHRSVGSLSCLYILPYFRGYRSLFFFDKVISLCRSKYDIITDYTPTKAVARMLRLHGFNSMQFISLRPDPVNLLLRLPFSAIRILFGNCFRIQALAELDLNRLQLSDFHPKFEGDVYHYKIDSKDSESIYISVVSHVWKSCVPYSKILWSSNPQFICDNWYAIQFNFITSLRRLVFADIPSLSVFFSSGVKSKPLDYYILCPDKVLLSLSGIGSELTFIK